jgi:GT2 family glycosyltransferase
VSEETFVSFVVIAYNEADNIARALAAISGLEGLGEHEIIVVDDGSHDSTARVVEDIAVRNSRVHLVRLAENRGRGYARSLGVAKACGSLIALVDADIVLPVNWLVRACAALVDHDAVGGIAVPDGDVAYIYKRFGLVPRIVRATTTVTGNNGLYRREVFDVADFDPSLREGEDSAFNHAMDHQGLSFVTIPDLFVRHEESKTFGTSLRWMFDTGRGATRQLLTYHEVRQPDLAVGAFACAAALGSFLAMREHRLIGAALPVGFVLAASAQHVRSRFETPLSHWSKVAPAVAVDSVMLAAYFAGRLVGLTALRRRANPAPYQERERRVSRLGTVATRRAQFAMPSLARGDQGRGSSYLQCRYYAVGHNVPVVLGQPEVVIV